MGCWKRTQQSPAATSPEQINSSAVDPRMSSAVTRAQAYIRRQRKTQPITSAWQRSVCCSCWATGPPFSNIVSHLIDMLTVNSELERLHIYDYFLRITDEYEMRARRMGWWLHHLRTLRAVFNIILPAILALQNVGYLAAIIMWLTWTLSLTVSLATGFIDLYRLDILYEQFTRASELLKLEGWRYFGLTGRYAPFKDHQAALPVFLGRVARIRRRMIDEEFPASSAKSTMQQPAPVPVSVSSSVTPMFHQPAMTRGSPIVVSAASQPAASDRSRNTYGEGMPALGTRRSAAPRRIGEHATQGPHRGRQAVAPAAASKPRYQASGMMTQTGMAKTGPASSSTRRSLSRGSSELRSSSDRRGDDFRVRPPPVVSVDARASGEVHMHAPLPPLTSASHAVGERPRSPDAKGTESEGEEEIQRDNEIEEEGEAGGDEHPYARQDVQESDDTDTSAQLQSATQLGTLDYLRTVEIAIDAPTSGDED